MPTKKQNAIARIAKVQRIYADGVGITPRSFVLDVLTDLHHYCESHGLSMDHLSELATRIYNRESNS